MHTTDPIPSPDTAAWTRRELGPGGRPWLVRHQPVRWWHRWRLGTFLAQSPTQADWQAQAWRRASDLFNDWAGRPHGWLIGRAPGEPLALSVDIVGEGWRNRLVILGAKTPTLLELEDIYLQVAIEASGAAAAKEAPGSAVHLVLLPRDAWVLPALRSLGAKLVTRAGLRTTGAATAELPLFQLQRIMNGK